MKFLQLIIALGFGFLLSAQESDLQQIKNDINELASDEMKGREVGTKGQDLAAEYIVNRMQSIGLIAVNEEQGFFQEFAIKPKANPHSTQEIADQDAQEIQVKNVIGFLNRNAQFTIVIGAHYDHLGMGAEGSLHAGKKEIHNGADDNASGVAIMLDIAHQINSSSLYQEYNFLFIAFSGEERGLWGSNYYCKNPLIPNENISYMINLDMVGRYEEQRGLAIHGVGTSPVWEDVLKESNESQVPLVLSESGVGPSDHTSFYLQDIPVLHFFTGQHEDYHKPSDDTEKINFDGMQMISELIIAIIRSAQPFGKLEFSKTKDESASVPKFTVTLGVMPDYMYQGNGMRIDGVSEGKPASQAKLEKGDVVIRLGDYEVSDMMSYMEALSKFKKGDKTTVVVIRGDKELKEKISF